MAGGIDWFRWHHGTVTDQKFPLIAKRAGATVAEAIAVWACLLEAASMNEKMRGLLDAEPDFEAMDCALGLPEGRSQAIFVAMRDRSLIDTHLQIVAWPRRQPKRERDDDTSTGRVQAFRDRQRQATPGNASETPSEATQRTETPRGEERREEEQDKPPSEVAVPARRADPPTPPPAFDGNNAKALNGKHVVPIAAGFELPEEWGCDAERLGWAPGEVLREAEKYRQYFVSGKGAGKRRSVKGWRQSWSTWLGKAAERRL